jgi:hypothetical protein
MNIDAIAASEVISVYHDLREAEHSFRMTKHELRARLFYSCERQASEARVTIVFTALSAAHYLQKHTGWPLSRIVKTLKKARASVIEVNGKTLTAEPKISSETAKLLDLLAPK